MGTEVAVAKDIAEESIQFFDDTSSGKKTVSQIVTETGYSQRTVYNRINQGRKIIDEMIREIGSKYYAEVWRKYEYIWDEAKKRWDETHDPLFLKEMRSVLEAFRKMQSLDLPAKAPVGTDGKNIQNTLIMVFDESQYAQREKELELKENKIVDSTSVLLQSDKNELESPSKE